MSDASPPRDVTVVEEDVPFDSALQLTFKSQLLTMRQSTICYPSGPASPFTINSRERCTLNTSRALHPSKQRRFL